ncbi:TPA: hypothetical protein QDA90_000724 [Burkholderia vietnamiensis]|nr:hypothetical protein [Burkholderia vietnamiensis]
MYQIDVSTVASTQPASTALGTVGFFTDGNAATGVAATVVPAEFLNAIMLEMMNAITGAGLTLTKSSFNQLFKAIQTIAQGGASNYAADTGAANAYAVTYSPTVTAPSDGMVRAFKVKTTNTGASTFALDGSGTTFPIYGLAGIALQGGELVANGIAVMRFNSSLASNGAWVLYHCSMGAQQIAPATKSSHATQSQQVQNSTHVYALDTGTATAYAASYTPAVTALTDGMVLTFRASHANTGAATFTPNSGTIAASPIWGGDHAALAGGEIALNGDCEVMWNASLNSGAGAWVLLASSGGYAKAATPPQFDNSTKLATAAFVQRAVGNYGALNAISAATTLTAANCGQTVDILGSSAFTVTLPAASACPTGSALTFICGTTYGSTLACQGTDKIYLPVGLATLALGYGDTLTIVSNGIGSWIAVGGSAQLSNAPEFGASLGAAGYQKQPGGLIFQWGGGTTSGGTLAVTFPIAFPTTYYQIGASVNATVAGTATVSAQSNSGFTANTFNPSGSATNYAFSWWAFGK